MKYQGMLFLALAAGSLPAQVTFDRLLHPEKEPAGTGSPTPAAMPGTGTAH